MRYFLFSMDGERPEECARDLKARGIGAVVAPPNLRAARACLSEGMDVYACMGAFGLKPGDPADWLAEDAFGERREWFHSGCPNEEALLERNTTASMNAAVEMGAKGIFADGLRFASPAPGSELFASCFCARCMRLGAEMGFDMPLMKKRVRAFCETPGKEIPREWLSFREACVKRAFGRFAEEAGKRGLESGAFAFAYSLRALVGQTNNAMEGLSILSPMLYRRYRHRPGIACLNAEYAALYAFFARRGDADPAGEIARLTRCEFPAREALPSNGALPINGALPANGALPTNGALPSGEALPINGALPSGGALPINGALPSGGAEEIWEKGFEPSAIGRETERARAAFSGALWPILQLDDDRLSESVAAAKTAGADAVGFFAYDSRGIENLPRL